VGWGGGALGVGSFKGGFWSEVGIRGSKEAEEVGSFRY